MDEKKKPLTIGLQPEVERGSEKIETLPSRIERYSKARELASSFSDWLTSQGEYEIAGHLIGCGNWLKFHHYYRIDVVKLVKASFCKKHLLCALCAIRRGAKQLRCYLDRYEVIKAENADLTASLMTLTVKNGTDLKERFEHLRNGVRILNKRRWEATKSKRERKGIPQSEWAKVLGLVGTYEATNKGNDWHPHTHIIVLHRDQIDQDKLSSEWQGITGDSYIVDVRQLQHPDEPARDFVEVFKYALKFGSLSHENQLEAYNILKGRRLIYSAGLFRGVEVPEDLRDEPLEDEPYLELFYRYIPGSGYNYDPENNTPF
jgi:hypothetical protein